MRIYIFIIFFFSFILLHRLASVPYSYEHSFFPLISVQWRYRAHLGMVVVCQIEHRTYRNRALPATYRHDTVQYETGTPRNPRVNRSPAKKERKKERKKKRRKSHDNFKYCNRPMANIPTIPVSQTSTILTPPWFYQYRCRHCTSTSFKIYRYIITYSSIWNGTMRYNTPTPFITRANIAFRKDLI